MGPLEWAAGGSEDRLFLRPGVVCILEWGRGRLFLTPHPPPALPTTTYTADRPCPVGWRQINGFPVPPALPPGFIPLTHPLPQRGMGVRSLPGRIPIREIVLLPLGMCVKSQ